MDRVGTLFYTCGRRDSKLTQTDVLENISMTFETRFGPTHLSSTFLGCPSPCQPHLLIEFIP